LDTERPVFASIPMNIDFSPLLKWVFCYCLIFSVQEFSARQRRLLCDAMRMSAGPLRIGA
jgi:hypothetical protein